MAPQNPLTEAEVFLLGALNVEMNGPVAAVSPKQADNEVAPLAAPVAAPADEATDLVAPIAPVVPLAPLPTITSSTATTPVATPIAPGAAWVPKFRNLGDDPNPIICPGLSHDCFHAVLSEAGYWSHIASKHNYTRKQLDKPNNAPIKDIFVPPRRADWWTNRGHDISYQGSDPKQIAARRRMAAGIRKTDPGYARAVYGSTMGTADV